MAGRKGGSAALKGLAKNRRPKGSVAALENGPKVITAWSFAGIEFQSQLYSAFVVRAFDEPFNAPSLSPSRSLCRLWPNNRDRQL